MTRRAATEAAPESQFNPSRRLFLGGAVAGAAALAAPVLTAQSASAATMTSAVGAEVLRSARYYVGRVQYVYGGSSPSQGFDCSGLTSYCYKVHGVTIPRSSASQYSAARKISRASAVPGDLVFFFTSGRVTHVAVYAGGNMMVDAGNPSTDVSYRQIYTSSVAFGTFR